MCIEDQLKNQLLDNMVNYCASQGIDQDFDHVKVRDGAVIKSEPRNIDDGAAHLVSRLTDTLIQAIRDPSILGEISDDEIEALKSEVNSARSAKEFNHNVEF